MTSSHSTNTLTRLALILSLASVSPFALTACGTDDTSSQRGDASGIDAGDGVDGPDISVGDADDDAGGDDVEGSDAAASNDTGPDDDVTDEGEEIDLVLPSGLRGEICADLCDDIEFDCDETEFEGQSCEDFCVDRLAENDDWLAGMICLSATCSLDGCFDGSPPRVREPCADFCDAVDECDAYDDLELPPDSVGICRAFCAGLDRGIPGAEDAFTCYSDELTATSCDLEAAGECFGPELDLLEVCEDICSVGEDCGEDSAFADDFGDVEGCVDSCLERGTFDGVVAMSLCLDIGECDAESCSDVPDEPREACTDACDALEDVCGDALEEDEGSDFCPGACEGISTAGAALDPEGAAACIRDAGECPDPEIDETEGDAAFGLLAGCMVQQDERCVELCPDLSTTCPDLVESSDECVSDCSFLAAVDGESFEGLLGCFDDAGDDCEALDECISTFAEGEE